MYLFLGYFAYVEDIKKYNLVKDYLEYEYTEMNIYHLNKDQSNKVHTVVPLIDREIYVKFIKNLQDIMDNIHYLCDSNDKKKISSTCFDFTVDVWGSLLELQIGLKSPTDKKINTSVNFHKLLLHGLKKKDRQIFDDSIYIGHPVWWNGEERSGTYPNGVSEEL